MTHRSRLFLLFTLILVVIGSVIAFNWDWDVADEFGTANADSGELQNESQAGYRETLEVPIGADTERSSTMASGVNLAVEAKWTDVSLDEPVSQLFATSDLSGKVITNALIKASGERVFRATRLSRAKMSSSSVVCTCNAFQKTSFDDMTIANSILTGGVAAFQLADFHGAQLNNAQLVGDAGAFQKASFSSAKLTNVLLAGKGTAFQEASFDGATLESVTVRCEGGAAFQAVSLNDAVFLDCDLSTIDAKSLASGVFRAASPPKYNRATRFPVGFNPKAYSWRLQE